MMTCYFSSSILDIMHLDRVFFAFVFLWQTTIAGVSLLSHIVVICAGHLQVIKQIVTV